MIDTIDYFSGTINLIKSDIDPNADIDIKYEKNELVSFDKKIILGLKSSAMINEGADFFSSSPLLLNLL